MPAPPLPGGTLQASSLGLIAGKVAQMGSGFIFWLVAANLSSAEEVGLTAALVSGVTLCTQFALLGVGAAFIRLFPGFASAPRALLDTAITMVSVAAVATGTIFLVLNGTLSENMAAVVTDVRAAALFLGMAVLGTLGALLDQVSMALGRGRQVLGRNVSGSLFTIAAAVALGSMSDDVPAADLFLCWVLGGAAAALIGVWQLRRSLGYTYRPRPGRSLAKVLLRQGVPNHALTLSERIPALLLPILVTELLDPTSAAHWYSVWMMAWAVYVVPVSIGIATFAEAARAPSRIGGTLRSSLRWSFQLGSLGAVGLALAAGPVLSMLGPDYAEEGAWPLRILALGVFPVIIVQTYFSLSRAAGRLREALAAGAVSACVAVTATITAGLARGLVGMAVAWVLVQLVTATWAGTRLVRMRRQIVARQPAEQVLSVAPSEAGSLLRAARPGLSPARPPAPGTSTEGTSASPGSSVHAAPPPKRPARTPGRHVGSPLLRGVPPRRRAVLLAVVLVVLVAGTVVSLTAAASVDMGRATDTGVVELLPGTYWMGVLALSALFGALLASRSAPDWVLGLCVVGLVVALFGISVVASDLPRLNVSFRHAGIVDYLIRAGAPDPRLDAYFSWPGFFMLGALLTEVAGFAEPLTLTHLAPLYSNLLYLPPLLLLMRALTPERRHQWLAIWIFYLAQWPNQDYFAPQSYTYLLYLTCLAIVLSWYSDRPPFSRPFWFRQGATTEELTLEQPVVPALPARVKPLLFVILCGLVLATVPSHQLTPYAVLVSLAVLAVTHGRSVRTLAIVTAVGALSWTLFAATAYVSGHLPSLLADAGDIGRATNANLLERIEGTPGHLLVVHVRLVFSGAVVALAALGTLRRLRQGRWDRTAVTLAGAAYLLIPMQPYGGEMLLRSYFFSLPFVAFLAAAAILPPAGRPRTVRVPREGRDGVRGRAALMPLTVVLLTAVLVPGLVTSRYGNARIDQFTQGESDLVATMYKGADPGAELFALANNAPWKAEEYEQHEYRVVDNMGTDPTDARDLAAHMTELADGTDAGGWFLVTRSQRAYTEFYGGVDRTTEEQLTNELVGRYGWHLVASSTDGALYAKEDRP